MPSRDAITLPDVLTTHDNLEIEMPPMPDADFLLSQMDDDTAHLNRKRRAGSLSLQDDYATSNYLQNSLDKNNFLDDEELGLEDDLGLGSILDYGDNIIEPSIEIGRDAPAARPVEDDVFGESDINMLAKDDTIIGRDREQSMHVSIADDDGFHIDEDGDINMGMDDMSYGIGDQPDASALATSAALNRQRISESPLSDIDPDMEAEVAAEHQRNLSLFQPEEDTEQSIHRNPAQRQRKLKIIPSDVKTTLTGEQIRAQQANRDAILQPQSFLPRDPNLLALMEMQRNGGFVSNIMGAGREIGWAPELHGMLTLDAIRQSHERKRKRDGSIAGLSEAEAAHKSPRLEIEQEEEDVTTLAANAGLGRDDTVLAADGTMIELPGADDGIYAPLDDDDNIAAHEDIMPAGSPDRGFDETTVPLVHPEDSGPVSLGTKHAVHLLREQFGPEAAESPSRRNATSVLFQDLLPEARTTKADATKMFFEILVLATKVAVKVEQTEGQLGGPIRVRGKRGLWGSWAEREAGGEIAEEAVSASVPVAVEV
jgi:cohesin complex subunit SCC1